MSRNLEVENRSQNYIAAILNRIQDFKSLVISVIVFGSYVKGDLSKSSDVDLLIIVSNSSTRDEIIELDKKLTEIQNQFGFSEPHTFSTNLSNFIAKQTGMFVSHFICKESSFINLNFANIFGTNRLLTTMLAPKGLVLSDLLDHAKVLYGKNILEKITKVKVSHSDLLKSLLMNMVLSLGSILLSLYNPKEAIRFSMESMKWSMYSSYYFEFRKSDKLSQIAAIFIKYNIASSQIKKMMQLRNQIKIDRKFVFLTLVSTLLIHLSHGKLNMVEKSKSSIEILLNKIPVRRPFNCIVFVLLSYVLGVTIIGIITNFPVWENIVWYGWIALFCFGTYVILYFSDIYRNRINEVIPKISIDADVRRAFRMKLFNFAFGKGNLALIFISVPSVCIVIFLSPTGFYHPLLSFYIDLYGAIWLGLFLSTSMWLAISFVHSTIEFSKYSHAVSVDIYDPDRCGGLKPIGTLALTGVRLWSVGSTAAAILLGIKLSPFVIFTFIAAMISVGVFLLVPQYKLHLVMKDAKNMAFKKILHELHELEKKLSLDHSETEVQKHIRAILIFNRIEKMQVWPFNTNILIGFVISFVIPVAVMLIGLFVEVPKISFHL